VFAGGETQRTVLRVADLHGENFIQLWTATHGGEDLPKLSIKKEDISNMRTVAGACTCRFMLFLRA
tara:strand:+ start:983 stop:1180 length:198 start_codon:yes stop_codon:yes gene_type:complete